MLCQRVQERGVSRACCVVCFQVFGRKALQNNDYDVCFPYLQGRSKECVCPSGGLRCDMRVVDWFDFFFRKEMLGSQGWFAKCAIESKGCVEYKSCVLSFTIHTCVHEVERSCLQSSSLCHNQQCNTENKHHAASCILFCGMYFFFCRKTSAYQAVKKNKKAQKNNKRKHYVPIISQKLRN